MTDVFLGSTTLESAADTRPEAVPARSWVYRRRTVFLSLLFIGAALTYLILYGEDSRLHDTLAFGLMAGGFGIISSYVFGAAWDDKNFLKPAKR